MVCRVCGCTDENGCLIDIERGLRQGSDMGQAIFDMALEPDDPPTCWWVEPDLCSGCAYDITIRGPVGATQQKERRNHG